MTKPRKPTRRNPIARALAQPLYRQRIVPDRRRGERSSYRKQVAAEVEDAYDRPLRDAFAEPDE